MSEYTAAADESAGPDGRGWFHYGGFVAPSRDWDGAFSTAWRERVLGGARPIPHLHMTDMRSRTWRERQGLRQWEADQKVEEAVRILNSTGSLYPLAVQLDAGHFAEAFEGIKVKNPALPEVAPFYFEPDYFCFILFAMGVLHAVSLRDPPCSRVHFLVERKNRVHARLTHFHSQMAAGVTALGAPGLAPLVGKLIPGGKADLPLQAADLLCWYTQRVSHGRLSRVEERHFWSLARRKGMFVPITREEVADFAARARAAGGLPRDSRTT